ncbi:uncharacterized protein LOC126551212 [Aphis gossypii]|uniref:uncharacterized protein LOC126551212 n=1 Tax=Aphis gossypii TaxID=80765 RepID=UPI002158DAC9|nr:uncharacterized protein LOC126551212 [Aphis gossypii]
MLECLLAYAESGVLDDLHADGWPRSPLAVAASLGRRPMMDEMLQDQYNDDDDLNWTVIHSACESGDVYTLERLLAYAEPGVLDALHAGGRPRPPLVVAACPWWTRCWPAAWT